jgi:hypothetical protein
VRIKESKDHLLAAAFLHLGLKWDWLTLQSLLFSHSSGLRCICSTKPWSRPWWQYCPTWTAHGAGRQWLSRCRFAPAPLSVLQMTS